MDKVRVGILGCAKIAEKYAIDAFKAIDNAEIISIASRDPKKAQEWAGRFNIKTAESYESLIINREVDAIYVPLPIGLHKEWIVKAANAQKHIVSEKSLAENFLAVKEIVEACEKNNLVLYENFMCDFHPQHLAVLNLISEGKIGKPFVFRGYFGCPPLNKDNFRYDKNLGGGVLNDMGAYTVFMARKMLATEPQAVTTTLFHDPDYGVDMKGTTLLEFSPEVSAELAFSFDAVYQNNYSLWGSRGLVNVKRAYSIPPDMKPLVELTTNENLKETTADIDIPAANHFELIFHDFCDTVLNKEKMADKIINAYEKILNQAKVLEAIRISAKESRKVNLSEIN